MFFADDIITSRTNPTVKWASALTDKRKREEASCFMAEGEKLSYEALKAGLPVTHIFVLESRADKIIPKLREIEKEGFSENCRVFLVSESVFFKISTENAPQGIISVIKHLDNFRRMDIIYKEEFLKNPDERLMLLSSVRDPANLGSIIRSAVAFGTGHIILSSDSVDIYNPKTVRAAMGSMYKIKVSYVTDFISTIAELRAAGRRVFSAELSPGAKTLLDTELSARDAVIIGNEGHGVSEDVSSAADGALYIPISRLTESLNASVAAGIFMWEQSKK